MSAAQGKHVVVVDGSNLATEGRTTPSLRQLDEAVRAYAQEDPDAEIVVVVDASFEHRIDQSEHKQLIEAELHGEVVSPPAGAIGRGDAFVLRIAERTGARVLSNDSFQEFHAEHPWLFDKGRLVGGKPVPGVGWIFTPRIPVRGPKSRQAGGKSKRDAAAPLSPPVKAAELAKAAKKVAARRAPVLPDGTAPEIGDVWPTGAPPRPAGASTKSKPKRVRELKDGPPKVGAAKAEIHGLGTASGGVGGSGALADAANATSRKKQAKKGAAAATASAREASPEAKSPVGAKASARVAPATKAPATKARAKKSPAKASPATEGRATAAPAVAREAKKAKKAKKAPATKAAEAKNDTGKKAPATKAAAKITLARSSLAREAGGSAAKTTRRGAQKGVAAATETEKKAMASPAAGAPPRATAARSTATKNPVVQEAIGRALAEVVAPTTDDGGDGRHGRKDQSRAKQDGKGQKDGKGGAKDGKGQKDGKGGGRDAKVIKDDKGSRHRRRALPPPAVNEPLAFITFVANYPLDSDLEGEVVSFTSHGAMVDVDLPRGGVLHSYIPLTAMGDPPPTKARQVLTRGERRRFVLVALDPPRRVAELALPDFVAAHRART